MKTNKSTTVDQFHIKFFLGDFCWNSSLCTENFTYQRQSATLMTTTTQTGLRAKVQDKANPDSNIKLLQFEFSQITDWHLWALILAVFNLYSWNSITTCPSKWDEKLQDDLIILPSAFRWEVSYSISNWKLLSKLFVQPFLARIVLQNFRLN